MSGLLQRIVHNEAMKMDPKEIYGWRVYLLACSACCGGMLFGMDSGIIGGVLTMPPFKQTYGLKDLDAVAQANLSANIVSTLQAGCFFGALLASPAAEKWGRRGALIGSALIGIIGVIMQASASGHLEAMYIGRLITGFGVGGASMINPLYVSENAPRAIRGGLTGLYQFFITMGIMLAFWINYGSLLHLTGPAMYLVPLAMQGLPAVLLFVGMLLCNESPRWLAKQDRWEEARATLSKAIALQLEQERALVGGSGFWDLMKEMWLIPGNRKRAMISVFLTICQQMTGTNAINYYSPQIFKNLGVTGNATNLFATGIYGIVKMVSCGVFLVFVADSLGRRRSLLWTSIAQGLAMLYIGLTSELLLQSKFGWGPVCWIYVSEIPTARLRSLNVAFGAAAQWLFNFVVARAVPNMLATVGANGYGTYIIFSCFSFSMCVFVWFFIPETKGMSLENMDDLFGVTELLQQKEGLEHSSTPAQADKATESRVERVA
ncbi:hypothetical protein N7486_008268 [Penicillium sp. IBT 16267x]|nr:hypothetical protein N7486_008268 [Penicillium sp. IBT 16267x]